LAACITAAAAASHSFEPIDQWLCVNNNNNNNINNSDTQTWLAIIASIGKLCQCLCQLFGSVEQHALRTSVSSRRGGSSYEFRDQHINQFNPIPIIIIILPAFSINTCDALFNFFALSNTSTAVRCSQ
jgi:hypothetical protein